MRQSRLGNPLAKGQGPGQMKKENITLLRRRREKKRKRSRVEVPTVFDTRGVAEEDVVLCHISANGGSVTYFCHLIFFCLSTYLFCYYPVQARNPSPDILLLERALRGCQTAETWITSR